MENTVEKNHVRAVARAGPVSRAAAGAALALLGCAVLGGCDKGTKPKEVKYNIYLGATYSTDPYDDNTLISQLYVYDADSLTQRDSIPLPAPSVQMAVSDDGRWLYVTNGRVVPGGVPVNVAKIDALTHEVVWSSPGPSLRVSLFKHGQLILNARRVLRAIDGATIRQFNDSLTPSSGPSSGTKVAVLVRARVRILDVETGEMVGDYGPNIGTGGDCPVFSAMLHPDEQRVLTIAVDTMYSAYWFTVGNILTRETYCWFPIYSTLGEFAISADGTIGVCTDAGYPPMWEQPTGVVVVDLADMQLLKRFDKHNGLPFYATGQVRFLPDDRRVVVAPQTGWEPGPMCVVDLRTLTVVDTVLQTFTYVTKRALGVGPRPE